MRKVVCLCLACVIVATSVGAAKQRPSARVAKPVPTAAKSQPVAPKPLATPAPALAATTAPVMSKAEIEGRIFERQQIMKQLDEDGETLGDIVAGLQPTSKLAETTRSIAKLAKDSAESFAATLPGGRSKPEVWSNHADFMQRMTTFVKEADELAKLGEAGNIPAVTEKLVTALPCKGCHDVYRVPKNAPAS